jgi:hypothetical protein
MRKNHADIAASMLVKALKALKRIPVEEMTAQDISKMVDVATKLERISRGEPTEKTENKTELAGGINITALHLSDLSDDELSQLDLLASKIAGGESDEQ